MILSETTLEEIKRAAIAEYPKEMCGVVVEGNFIQLENTSNNPEDSFKFDVIQYLQYSSCDAIIHSHTQKPRRNYRHDLRTPSIVDRRKQIESNKPWGILATDGITALAPIWLPRTYSQEYIGRPFIWFIHDCYTLVQDYYFFEFGIELMDHALEFDYGNGFRIENNIFDKYIADAGFYDRPFKPGELKKGDLVLLTHLGVDQSHLGIFTGESILHQDSLSVEIPLSMIQKKITKVLTHKELL